LFLNVSAYFTRGDGRSTGVKIIIETLENADLMVFLRVYVGVRDRIPLFLA
jgi:hypothetical protein